MIVNDNKIKQECFFYFIDNVMRIIYYDYGLLCQLKSIYVGVNLYGIQVS